MFASLLRLSVQNMARLRIKDAYGLHRVVYDLFEPVRGDSATEEGQAVSSGILYADRGMKQGWREILIVSDRAPRQAAPCGKLETREIPVKLLDFPAYRFEITINPVKREKASGKLVPLRTREAVSEWFAAKAPSWGFELEHLEVGPMNVARFEKKGHLVTLGQATLTGLLQVRDAERFAHSFRRGLGRGKAFGCGLLQITPVV